MRFAQYDVVNVKAFHKEMMFEPDGMNWRPAQTSDVATIIEVYNDPSGYELKCCGPGGVTEWLLAFAPEDIELQVAK
jgi:hypothetical protein